MLHDVVLKVAWENHEVEAEVDAALATAAAPASLGLVYGDGSKGKSPGFGHGLETWREENLGVLPEALLHGFQEPGLQCGRAEVRTCGVVADQLAFFLLYGGAGDACFLQPEMEVLGIYASVWEELGSYVPCFHPLHHGVKARAEFVQGFPEFFLCTVWRYGARKAICISLKGNVASPLIGANQYLPKFIVFYVSLCHVF